MAHIKLSKFLSTIILLLAIISCNNDESNDNGFNSIASDLLLEIIEDCSGNQNSELNLKIDTEVHFECANYRIETNKSTRGSTLVVEILGVSISNVCLTAFGPATTSVNLNIGIEEIVIIKNGKSDIYGVSIDNDQVKPTAKTSNFSSFGKDSYQLSCL